MRRPTETPHSATSRMFLLFTFLLVFSACRQNTSDAPKVTSTTRQSTVETIDRAITISMKGADNADFRGVNKLNIQTPSKDARLNIMAISTEGFIDVGGNVKLSIGIVLIGIYEGDGKYVLPPNVAPSPGSTPDASNPATLSGNSRVTFYADSTSMPGGTFRGYNDLTQPCPIAIRNKGKSGEVHCPEIRSIENTTVSFDMVWGE